MSEELGMMFIPDLNVIVKVHRDKKGEYIKVPKFGKCYLKEKVEATPYERKK